MRGCKGVMLTGAALLALAATADCQEKFRLPGGSRLPPITYLTELRIADPSRTLGESEQYDVCSMFTQAYVISMRKYQEDYLLFQDKGLFLLMLNNFPDLRKRVGEGGIFLGQVVRFFNSEPNFRSCVVRTLSAFKPNSKGCDVFNKLYGSHRVSR
jgi:hypothetical protein